MSDPVMQIKKFQDINLQDPFFDGLKKDYLGFDTWFTKKSKESAYVFEDAGKIQGFLYLKQEQNLVNDVDPPLEFKRYLKVGTFKIEAHGTRLGERFLKKVFDHAIEASSEAIYVTIFPHHQGLINLFKKFGFERVAHKSTPTGLEDVYLRKLDALSGEPIKDYPFINTQVGNNFLLSILPQYHTQLFPDSILKNESYDLIKDVSHTNSIHKIYLCKMRGVEQLKRGDKILIYRMKDDQGPAYFRSVATSVCIVEELKNIHNFSSFADFEKYCAPYSIFTQAELQRFYTSKSFPHIIKMTYNGAFKKRVIRKELIETVGLDANAYWGFMQLNSVQFKNTLRLGQVNANIVVD